ncbi:MAG: histidine phosphatase family protein [Planctomycetaceae bacterium]|nr:histidine phosphatase family protein [Planctomycetaceae bacterium]
MKTLILMRHAKAAPLRPGERDFDRCLTESGLERTAESVKHLKEAGIHIDSLLASAARRTMQTAQAVAEVLCPDTPFHALDELYLASPESYLTAVSQYAEDHFQTAFVVGHNPGIGSLMCGLANRGLEVPTATTCVFEFSADSWCDLSEFRHQRPKTRLKLMILRGEVVAEN